MIEHSMPENAILAIWQSNREGKRVSVIETKETVSIYDAKCSKWRQQSLNDLFKFKNVDTWAEVFIRCGKCKRQWAAWVQQNPPPEDRAHWNKKAIRFIIRKSLI